MAMQPALLTLGCGSWGSALSLCFARLGIPVTLWGHDAHEVSTLKAAHENTLYLPGFPFPENLNVTGDLEKAFHAVGDEAIILIAVPSHVFAAMLTRLVPYLKPTHQVVWATKGLSSEGELLSEVFQAQYPAIPFSILSGPSFAKEVAAGVPTAVTLASTSQALGERLKAALHHELFRLTLCDDIVGVQLGGVVKNVMAIAVGMIDGLGLGANTRAQMMTRGLAELCHLGQQCGAQLSTFLGLSGVGDLILTCTDDLSRNRRFGKALGQGKNQLEAEKAIGQVVEGKTNVAQVLSLAERHQVVMPICALMYKVIFADYPVQSALNDFLTMDPEWEVIEN